MPATTYFKGLILSHALLGQPYSVPNWYVGLFTGDPTSAGLLTNEVQAGDYDRRPVLWNSNFVNSNTVAWASPVTNWGSITYIAALNDPTPGSGNMLAYEPLGSTFAMPIGQPAEIPPGGLAMTIF